MKKLYIGILICLSCMFVFVGCFKSEDLSSGPKVPALKLSDTKNCTNCSIKWGTGHDASASYYITPENFDYDKLEEKNYKMKIVVSFSVNYKKDYDVPFDIGYAGSPKYEVSIMNNDLVGVMDRDQTTKTVAQSRSITYVVSIANLRNTRILLIFSTNNIQNVIYFKNITVRYTCVK